MNEKSQVEDIDRSIYDIRDEEKDAYRMEEGLTPEIVEKLSEEKEDPEAAASPEKWEWMGDLIQILLFYEIYKRRHNTKRGILRF